MWLTIINLLGALAAVWGFISSLPKGKRKQNETDRQKEERERKWTWSLLFFSILIASVNIGWKEFDNYRLKQSILGTWKEKEGPIEYTFEKDGSIKGPNDSDVVNILGEEYYSYSVKYDESKNKSLILYKDNDGTPSVLPIKIESNFIVIGRDSKFYKKQ